MDKFRDIALRKIAELWRGDWSGREFDGRTGHEWILTALDSTEQEVELLIKILQEIADSY